MQAVIKDNTVLYLLCLLFDPEIGDPTFLQNADKLLPDYIE
jgi:hypothetical protein